MKVVDINVLNHPSRTEYGSNGTKDELGYKYHDNLPIRDLHQPRCLVPSLGIILLNLSVMTGIDHTTNDFFGVFEGHPTK